MHIRKCDIIKNQSSAKSVDLNEEKKKKEEEKRNKILMYTFVIDCKQLIKHLKQIYRKA